MLVLHSTSRCDVCLLEYTWETSARVPHAIACGHIFCRDCLYATLPPLCPLCRKHYQPAKIKKLHVDRPENVDEAREAELGRQQLELLEQLVDVWDLELQEGLVSDLNGEGNREGSVANRGHHEDSDDHERRADTEEESHPAGPSPAVPGGAGPDEQIGGLLGLREADFPRFDSNDDVEQILDGIAGVPGAARGFLERWGSTLVADGHVEGPIVTVREAQKVHVAEVLRQVDVWLEGRDEDSAVALRKSRLFFAQHVAVRVALKDALEFARSLNEERSNLIRDLQELEKIKHGLQEAGEELQRYNALVVAISMENQNLKARLLKRSRNSSPPLRNPLPPPPEPVSTDHVPTFAQAISEGAGSAYNGSAYSSAESNTGVRFAISPDLPDRARERYPTGNDDGSANPNRGPSRSGRRKGKGKDSSHHSYRDDSGYFDDDNRWKQSSSGPATSAPAAVQGFTVQRSNDYGAYNVSHEQHRRNGRHSSNHASRSGSQVRPSQPLDVFAATSHYLREYSMGFANGQAAALGVGPFVTPSPQLVSAPARTSSHAAADNTASIAYTSDSMEDASRQESLLRSHSASRSRSPSRSHRSMTSQFSNPHLASILSSPPRQHLSLVSLPSVSSHGQPSPAFSSNQRPTYVSSHSSSNILAHENDSPRHSVASSGQNPPPSLPHDPVAAAAMIADRFSGQYPISPSNRSQRTSVSSGWGTVYSNARSNSLISGLRGLPVVQGDSHDSASIRTRTTRFSMELVDIGDRDSVRDSRRESHASVGARSNMSEIEEEAREGSPVRYVDSMVGVLPVEDSTTNSQQQSEGDFSRGSASMNRIGSNPDTISHSQRSATAIDWRMTNDGVWNYSSNSSQSRLQTAHQQSRQTESQPVNTDWVPAQNPNTSSGGYYLEYERQGGSRSPRHHQAQATSRSREHRSNREEDHDRYRRPTTTRSQTSMGVSSTHSGSGSSSWSYEHGSNNRSSHTHNRSHEQISPTSYPSVIQSSSSASVNPNQPARSTRDVDREQSSRSRAHRHGHSHNSNTRPSLLTRDLTSAFPVSVETTDDERYPHTYPTRSRTAMNTSDGRNTRLGSHANTPSATISSSGISGDMAGDSASLQSFGTQNALGLELITTTNGINAPVPVSRTSTQGFLRSFSHGDS